MKRKRKRVTVDARLQGAIALRVILYWTLCVATMTVIIGGSSLFRGNETLWKEFRSVALIAFMPLPIVLLDTLMFSNRIAGPIYRLRCELSHLASGQPAKKLSFRKADHFHDAAESVNELIDRLEAENSSDAPERDAVEETSEELQAVG